MAEKHSIQSQEFFVFLCYLVGTVSRSIKWQTITTLTLQQKLYVDDSGSLKIKRYKNMYVHCRIVTFMAYIQYQFVVCELMRSIIPTNKTITNVNVYTFRPNLIEIVYPTTECLSYCCKFT